MKGYFDGCSKGNPGQAGAGALLVSDAGETVWETARSLGVKTNNEAEYAALLFLLTEAKKRGVEKLLICGDSKLVVSQVSRKWKINLPHLRKLAQQAWALMEGMDVTLEWVPRERNARADELSNEALKSI